MPNSYTSAFGSSGNGLPLTGGTVTGNVDVTGSVTAGSNIIATGSLASTGANVEVQSNAGLFRFGTAGDVVLARELANTLALRNGTNAQTFLVNGTYTDASNYLRGSLGATSTAVQLKAESAGTGAAKFCKSIKCSK
jgi:hypothetical protein